MPVFKHIKITTIRGCRSYVKGILVGTTRCTNVCIQPVLPSSLRRTTVFTAVKESLYATKRLSNPTLYQTAGLSRILTWTVTMRTLTVRYFVNRGVNKRQRTSIRWRIVVHNAITDHTLTFVVIYDLDTLYFSTFVGNDWGSQLIVKGTTDRSIKGVGTLLELTVRGSLLLLTPSPALLLLVQKLVSINARTHGSRRTDYTTFALDGDMSLYWVLGHGAYHTWDSQDVGKKVWILIP